MYGYPLILLPDVCELPVKRQRKKKAPMPVSAPPPPPPPPPPRHREAVRAAARDGRSLPREKRDSRSAPL